MALCTLDDVKTALKASQAGTAADTPTEQAKLLRAIYRVTRRVEQMRFLFEPMRETEYITTAFGMNVSGNGVLTLSRPLLEIISISNDGTTYTQDTDFYAYPRGKTPIYQLRLNDQDNCRTWYPTNCNVYDSLVIDGIWGYKENYSREGWISADTLSANITSSVTTLNVADVDGADFMNRTPRISAGNLIKIDSEFMEVLATNTTTNVVTVRRGARGTTAAAHTLSTAVYVWNVQEDIRDTAARQSAAMYARIGAFETTVVSELGQVSYPPDLLAELMGVLQGYVLS